MKRRNALMSLVVIVLVILAAQSARAQASGGSRIKQQDLFESSNVLTPGEADDWPLSARDSETVILSVSSDNFDPMVELVSPEGNVIAQNDDVRQGEQDALLLARIEKGGDYKVRVKASKGAAGGRYQFSVRRFIATDTTTGSRGTGVLGQSLAQWHRFQADANQTLILTARAASFRPTIDVYGPTGEYINLRADTNQQGTARLSMRVNVAGAFYARISSTSGGGPRDSYTITIAAARVFNTSAGAAPEARRLDAGGLDLWKFEGKAGDIVKIQAKAQSGAIASGLSFLPPRDKQGETKAPEGSTPAFVFLPVDPKAGGEIVALLNQTGTYQASVTQPFGLGVDYTLMTSLVAKPFKESAEASGSLALGASDYWTIEGAAGQIMRVEGISDQFDAHLELFAPKGEVISKNDDGATGRNAMLTALLVEPGRYILRVHSFGDGGSGAYKLRRVANPAKPIAIGARADGTVGAGGREILSFQGRAGQTVIISLRSADFDASLALFGPDAIEVASDDDSGEGTDSLIAVRLPLDGVYTIWVSAKSGGGQYSLRLVDAQ